MHSREDIILQRLLELQEESRSGKESRFAPGSPTQSDLPLPIDPKNVKDPIHKIRMGWNKGGGFERKEKKPVTPAWTTSNLLLWPSEKIYKFLGIGGTNRPKQEGPGLVHKKKGSTTQAFTQLGEGKTIEELEAQADHEYDTRGMISPQTRDALTQARIAAGQLPPTPEKPKRPEKKRRYR